MCLLRKHSARAFALSLMTGVAPLALACALPAAAQTAGQSVALSIPAQPVPRALAALSSRTGVQILYTGTKAYEITSRSVSGAYTADHALRTLLSGTGISYRFVSANSVTISVPGEQTPQVDAGADAGDAVILDAIDVTTSGAGGGADMPYTTPGSVNYISQQDIQRFPGTSAGDIFKSTPGVISGSNRNGAAIDPNIRGMQGVNRVATTIDGSEQSTSNYRGYYGSGNRSYFDPDLIGGVTVTKGPDGGSAGAIGGTIAMETLNVEDILRPGDTYGARLRGSVGTNSIDPRIGSTDPSDDQSSILNGSGSFSSVLATRQENVDLLAGFVRRKTGNHFAGTEGDLTAPNYAGVEQRLSSTGYGEEVFNSSQDVTSALVKTTLRPADGHELKLSFMHYENTFGEVTPLTVNAGSAPRQFPLSWIQLDQATARYHWRPEDNDWIDLRVNAAISNTSEDQVYTIAQNFIPIAVRSQNYSVDAYNTSRFDIAHTPFSLTYGGSFKYEDASPREYVDDQAGAYPVDGTRQVATLYVKGKWEPLSWLTLDAGLEYLNYETDYRGTPAYTYSGPEYTGYEGDGFSPSFGVTVTPLEGWQLFAKYSTGIRPMSLRETSWTRFDQAFNPDVRAEEARNWEFGTNLLKNDLFVENDKARLKLAYFNNYTDGYVGRSWPIGGLGLTHFNYDFVQFEGIEFSGGYDAGWIFTDFALNYYTDWEACLVDGTCIQYTIPYDYLTNQVPPEFTASLTAGVRLLDERLTLGGRVSYTGERLIAMNMAASLAKNWAPYTLVDLFAQWKINDNLTLDISAENLLDRYYVDALNNTDMPAPGRTIRASLTGKFGVEDAQIDVPHLGRATFGEPGSDWTGLYLGVHTGYGNGSIQGETTAADGTPGGIPATESADQDLAGLLGGVQIGFNYQLGNRVVLGIEGDMSWTKLEGYDEIAVTESEGEQAFTRNLKQASMKYQMDWLATVRGRVGYAADRLFVYGTGGLAFLKETEERTQFRTTSLTSNLPSFSETSGVTRQGWTLGAGAEYAISNRWSVKGEYNYSHFGEEDFLFAGARSGASAGFNYRDCSSRPCTTTPYPDLYSTTNGRKASNEADFHSLKIGLNYRF